MNIISKILKYLKKRKKLVKNIVLLILVVTVVILFVMTVRYKSLYNEQIETTHSEKISNAALENQKSSLLEEKAELARKNAELNAKVQEHEEQLEAYKLEVNELTAEVERLKSTTNKSSSNSTPSSTVASSDESYMQATTVWNYLKSLGLNNYVCAGIIGNIMAEVGGQTLDISRWPQYSQSNYYGICQWVGSRKTRLLNDFGQSLEAQLEFLGVELFEVIPEDNSFYDMQNEKEAALYFAKYYERCGSASYGVRKTNATKALKYFTA